MILSTTNKKLLIGGLVVLIILSICIYLLIKKKHNSNSCTPACTDETPDCNDGVCVCNSGSCNTGRTCNSNGTCGNSCTPTCGGETPVCNNGVCVCNSGSCNTGRTCNSNGTCASSCTPTCGGETPHCNNGVCVCDSGSCTGGKTCNSAGKCIGDVIVVVGLTYTNITDDNTTGVIYVSNDGMATWTQKYTGGGEYSFNGVAFNGRTTWVAVGDTGVFSSTDANTWKKINAIPNNCNDVLWIESKQIWVIICKKYNSCLSSIYYSTTSEIESLTPATTSPFYKCISIIFNGTNFIALGCETQYSNNSIYITRSNDFTTFSKVKDNLYKSDYGGISYFNKTSIIASEIDPNGTTILYSKNDNLQNWTSAGDTSANIILSGRATAIACNSSGLFVAVGNNSCVTINVRKECIVYSTDGITWTNSSYSPNSLSSCVQDPLNKYYYGAYAVAPYRDKNWIVVGCGYNGTFSPSVSSSMLISTDNAKNFTEHDFFKGKNLVLKRIAIQLMT